VGIEREVCRHQTFPDPVGAFCENWTDEAEFVIRESNRPNRSIDQSTNRSIDQPIDRSTDQPKQSRRHLPGRGMT
jgi:hypothetical protein